jgi:hypothetical protein
MATRYDMAKILNNVPILPYLKIHRLTTRLPDKGIEIRISLQNNELDKAVNQS